MNIADPEHLLSQAQLPGETNDSGAESNIEASIAARLQGLKKAVAASVETIQSSNPAMACFTAKLRALADSLLSRLENEGAIVVNQGEQTIDVSVDVADDANLVNLLEKSLYLLSNLLQREAVITQTRAKMEELKSELANLDIASMEQDLTSLQEDFRNPTSKRAACSLKAKLEAAKGRKGNLEEAQRRATAKIKKLEAISGKIAQIQNLDPDEISALASELSVLLNGDKPSTTMSVRQLSQSYPLMASVEQTSVADDAAPARARRAIPRRQKIAEEVPKTSQISGKITPNKILALISILVAAGIVTVGANAHRKHRERVDFSQRVDATSLDLVPTNLSLVSRAELPADVVDYCREEVCVVIPPNNPYMRLSHGLSVASDPMVTTVSIDGEKHVEKGNATIAMGLSAGLRDDSLRRSIKLNFRDNQNPDLGRAVDYVLYSTPDVEYIGQNETDIFSYYDTLISKGLTKKEVLQHIGDLIKELDRKKHKTQLNDTSQTLELSLLAGNLSMPFIVKYDHSRKSRIAVFNNKSGRELVVEF